MEKSAKNFYSDKYASWLSMKDLGPAARHTRRIILDWLSGLSFNSLVDVSCGGGQLLAVIRDHFSISNLTGTEFTDQNVTTNQLQYPDIVFTTFDLEKDPPLEPKEIVLCIDVLEHVLQDQLAVSKIKEMTKKYALLVVPLGKVSNNERLSLGHLHGYTRKGFDQIVLSANLKIIKSLEWGFPFYSLVRLITNLFNQSPAEGKTTPSKTAVFKMLYFLYKLNLPILGGRYFILCEPENS